MPLCCPLEALSLSPAIIHVPHRRLHLGNGYGLPKSRYLKIHTTTADVSSAPALVAGMRPTKSPTHGCFLPDISS